MQQYDFDLKAFQELLTEPLTNIDEKEHRTVEKIRPQELIHAIRVTLSIFERKLVKFSSDVLRLPCVGQRTPSQTCIELNDIEGQSCSLRELMPHSMNQ